MDAAAERIAVQLPRARHSKRVKKTTDLAREAVGWNGVLAGGLALGAAAAKCQSLPRRRAYVGARLSAIAIVSPLTIR
jgi:hypothetical protein